MENLNQTILYLLEQGRTFALATIMSHKGSTPRTSGSKMIVLKDKTIYGTIGGGLVEARVIDTCVELANQNLCRIKQFSLDKELKDGLDMVCGGELTVLIETLAPGPEQISVFQSLVHMEKEGKKPFLVSKIQGCSKSDFTLEKCLVLFDGATTGAGILPKPLFDEILNNKFSSSSPELYNQGLEEFIIEPVQNQGTMIIFGAGHVGFQLAKMAALTDFQTIIVDDREEFANCQRFPHSKSVLVVDRFDHCFENLPVDDNSYIVILTRGHLHDQTVLEGALKTSAAYIGMIGSRTKRDKIYKNLKKIGFSDQALDKVYSPIGLEINSETPAEIAVSIIGQIIQVRALK